MNNMHTDKEWWTSLKYPATPNDSNVAMYKSLIKGTTVLLLGSTKPLLPLATIAYDLCPKYNDPKIIDKEWTTIDTKFDTIIGDGVMSFGQDFSNILLSTASRFCSRLVVRSFSKFPVWPPRYAKSIPQPDEFEIIPEVVLETDSYRFYVWDFNV